MELTLTRKAFTDQSTTGELMVEGALECYTLEDVVRDEKIATRTAIPYGRYEIAISYSDKFRKLLPLVMRVPNFEGVRIHAGNTAFETDGCILVGSTVAPDFVGGSRSAFAKLFSKIKIAMRTQKVFITVAK